MDFVVTTLQHRRTVAQFLGPLLSLLNYKRSKSLMTIFWQNDYPAKHYTFIVNGI